MDLLIYNKRNLLPCGNNYCLSGNDRSGFVPFKLATDCFGLSFFRNYYLIFLFALIDDHKANPIQAPQMRPVMISGTSWTVEINIMIAKAKIARNAQCSRNLYFIKVHFFTSITVRLLTNIAPIPSHKAMIKIFLLKANAPITPSKEKLASKTSR
ncbi:MAG: hypothetical protein WCJ39_03555 [bacterium]